MVVRTDVHLRETTQKVIAQTYCIPVAVCILKNVQIKEQISIILFPPIITQNVPQSQVELQLKEESVCDVVKFVYKSNSYVY